MDGNVGMEGQGPTAGKPKQIGVIMASENGFDMDYIATEIIGVDQMKIPILKQAKDRKLLNIDEINVMGEAIENVKVKGFDVPALSIDKRFSSFEKGIMKELSKKIKPSPVVDFKKCVGCGNCAQNCPPKVIKMENKKAMIDLNNCIRCFCCHELCPYHAIDIKRNFVSRLLARHRM